MSICPCWVSRLAPNMVVATLQRPVHAIKSWQTILYRTPDEVLRPDSLRDAMDQAGSMRPAFQEQSGTRAPSRRGGSLPRRGLDAVLVLLRIARVEMRLEFDFGEIFEMFGLAEQFPALERPVGGLLTTEGR